jgi:O-antigen/teichoic acid export membrane protein
MVMANGALALPALPRMMRAHGRGSDALAEEVRIFHHYLVLGLIPFAGLLVTLGPRVVQELGGTEFGVGVGVLFLVALGIALDNGNGLAHYVLVVAGRTVVLQNITLLGGLANIVLNLVMVPIYGIAGAAGVSALTFLAMEWTIVRYAQREAPIISAYDWRGVRCTVVASLAAGLAATPVLNAISARVLALALAGMVYVFVVLVGLILSKAITSTDVGAVRRLFVTTAISGGQS